MQRPYAAHSVLDDGHDGQRRVGKREAERNDIDACSPGMRIITAALLALLARDDRIVARHDLGATPSDSEETRAAVRRHDRTGQKLMRRVNFYLQT